VWIGDQLNAMAVEEISVEACDYAKPIFELLVGVEVLLLGVNLQQVMGVQVPIVVVAPVLPIYLVVCCQAIVIGGFMDDPLACLRELG
jgi:hypothetical protein